MRYVVALFFTLTHLVSASLSSRDMISELGVEYSEVLMFLAGGKIRRKMIPISFHFGDKNTIYLSEEDLDLLLRPVDVSLGFGHVTGYRLDGRIFSTKLVSRPGSGHVRLSISPTSYLMERNRSISIIKPTVLSEGKRGRLLFGSSIELFSANCVKDSVVTVPITIHSQFDEVFPSQVTTKANVRISRMRSPRSLDVVLDPTYSRSQMKLPLEYFLVIQNHLIESGAVLEPSDHYELVKFSNCTRSTILGLPIISLLFVGNFKPIMISPLDYIEVGRRVCVLKVTPNKSSNDTIVLQPFRIPDLNFRLSRSDITFCDNSRI